MPSNELDLTGVSEDAVNLRDMMTGVLERVQTVFQSYNVELPNRRYWMMSTPAVDCEQLVVSFQQMYLGAPGAEVGEPQRCNVPRSASIAITISRATPVVSQNGRPPTPNQIEAASEFLAVDSWVLMESINQLDQWDATGYGVGVVATLDVGPPEGGFQTTTLLVTMAVP
jgi:hypothetical protein|tara:strand:- start:3149 stop:3658 length:510 start_codon:yes stop_codon:yes gene_type:complete